MKPFLSSFKLFVFVLAAFTTLFYSCSEEPIKPPPPPPPPHKQQDTTLHDVEWRVTTFGYPEKEGSYFKDVFAISDSDVWAVGKIISKDSYTLDSLGIRIDPYNTAHWDGREFKLTSLKTKHWGGDSSYSEMRAVFGFGSNDVWFFDYAGSYLRWDGKKYYSKFINEGRRGSIVKAWGRSSKDFYLVGTNGSITNYFGSGFQLIESGTNLDLSDVYGAANGDVWTGGYQYWDLKRTFLRITNKKVINVDRSPMFLGASNIWIFGDTLYADVGTGVFIQSINDTSHWHFTHWKDIAYPLGYVRGFRGSAHNNLFAVGDFCTIIHYNGKSWHMYFPFDINNRTRFWSVAVTKRYVFAVGYDNENRAVVYQGILKQ